jgi:hypothetical protein
MPWTQQALVHGWGYAVITPASIQPDTVNLDTGIIGLTRHGEPRSPEDWGMLRAWQWGISRFVDALEEHAEWNVDAKRLGMAGLGV